MAKMKNGTVYGKYIKIKNGAAGAASCTKYISDPEKTALLNPEADTAWLSIDYVMNETKTLSPDNFTHLISGHNCNPDTASEEFSRMESLYHMNKTECLNEGHKANMAFHVILSYKGHDIPPKIVHEMGCEFMRRVAGDEFKGIVTTHLNTDNYHNHVLICAYAIDGKHKFRDDWKLYEKLREIANDISLEYGYPIFMNEKDHTRYRSWKEIVDTKEVKNWRDAITKDFQTAIETSSSYEEVLSHMKDMGYTVTPNSKSTTFSKDDIRVRDNRLGYEFTRQGIEDAIEKRRQLISKQMQIEELKRLREGKKKRTYHSVYVPLYDDYGRRRSFLLRFLLMIREMVLQSMDDYYCQSANKNFPDNLAFQTAEKRLKTLDDAIQYVEKHNIQSIEQLDSALRGFHLDKKKAEQAMSQTALFLDEAAILKEDAVKFKELFQRLKEYGIDPSEFIPTEDPEKIRKNLALLNPMGRRTKSVLYQTIHASKYRLSYPFDCFTETQAQEIITSIRENKTANLPIGLTYGYQKRADPQKPKANQQPTQSQKELWTAHKDLIAEFRTTAGHLSAYGLTSEEGSLLF